MPADILLYALIAAGLIFWLRSILGTKDDDDNNTSQRPPMFMDDKNDKAGNNNVVSLNPSTSDANPLPKYIKIDNKTTENKLEDIERDFPDFELARFASGAESAFVMIVEAFAKGDTDTLEGLLAPEVFVAFSDTITDREEKGEQVETTIHAVEKMDITDAHIKNDHLFITVRFSARETCVIRDKDDNILFGNPEDTTKMVDVWMFGKDLNSDGPEWYLFETRDDEVEDHKTPIPEGGSDKSDKKKK